MTTEKKKAAYYIQAKLKKGSKEDKPTYWLNLWKNEYSYGATIPAELTEEQWVEIYREAKKGKEGKFWLEMKEPRAQKTETTESDDVNVAF